MISRVKRYRRVAVMYLEASANWPGRSLYSIRPSLYGNSPDAIRSRSWNRRLTDIAVPEDFPSSSATPFRFIAAAANESLGGTTAIDVEIGNGHHVACYFPVLEKLSK